MMDIQKQKLIIEGAVTYSRLFDALKGMYEVDDDDSVWEIFSQADDQIEEVVNALKLLSAPPAVMKVPDLQKIYSLYCTPTTGSMNALAHIEGELLRLNSGSVADE
ncbi:MAG: hypothetical protein E6X23_20965 [Mixta calida]|uniref:hypothetical protein n=1 Tax=Mixta calida TaxID=665913 RepID=UPI002914A006|nr:hypothetical protein [Mixta calida]MDU4943964.1 hypothetical protein [Mixta calida]